uniref:Uncharacterized protein n=1 Tax=Setaria digitata TaxID=48799 RepID=A0A915PUQ0_9BILA
MILYLLSRQDSGDVGEGYFNIDVSKRCFASRPGFGLFEEPHVEKAIEPFAVGVALSGVGDYVSASLPLFLDGKRIESDYPISDPYFGHLSSLSFSRDVECFPLERFVDIYHCGQSDALQDGSLFYISAPHCKISDVQFELPSKDTDLRGQVFESQEMTPVVPASGSDSVNKGQICRPLESLVINSRPAPKSSGADILINSRSAGGRPLPIGIAHPLPKIRESSGIRRFEEISEVRGSDVMSAPTELGYHRKTREVDYWIGRRSERQSKPYRDLAADIGIDLASDSGWEESNLFEAQLEAGAVRKSGRDLSVYPGKILTRKVLPTANLHWTTVSETTSVSYKKRISIERRRPHPTSPSHLGTYRRQYRPPPPPPEVSAYARHDRAIFISSTLPRTYAGVAIEGDLRMQRARYETSSLPATYYSSNERRVSFNTHYGTQHNPVRYDLPRPSSPPRYDYWTREHSDWTVEGSPRRSYIADRGDRSAFDDQYTKQAKQEALHYQKSNLQEIPIVSLINDLPMIEDGADECSCTNIAPTAKIETQDLTPGEHSRPCRSAPLRRARQRIRNLCTML